MRALGPTGVITRFKRLTGGITNNGLQIKQNDDLDVRDKILNMTPEQRKALGINKSTLWQIQKNLRDGKKIKLYDKVKAKIT